MAARAAKLPSTALVRQVLPMSRMSAFLRRTATFAFLLAICHSAVAQEGPLEIDITEGRIEPVPFALTLDVDGNLLATDAGDIGDIVVNDLQSSALFRQIDPDAYMQRAADAAEQPRFRDWRIIDAQVLVAGTVRDVGDGTIEVAARAWDVYGGREMIGVRLNGPLPLARRMAHVLADRIYSRVTGEPGYFDTRILYVAESGPATERVKRLAIMDQDGANHRYLTDGSHLVLTPRFSPDGKGALYFSYQGREPSIFRYDLDAGRSEALGQFSGMTFAPRFHPEGSEVAMSLARDGVTNVFALDLETGDLKQLTRGRAIDTSPSYSPEGDRIVFSSDRSGRPHLFVMSADGGVARRISFGEGSYTTPVWSPRGDYIAFTKSVKGRFYIGLMHPDGTGERLIADGFLVEGPSWAPNGRLLAFARTEPSPGTTDTIRIYTIDITGNRERELPTPNDASDPSWGPDQASGS